MINSASSSRFCNECAIKRFQRVSLCRRSSGPRQSKYFTQDITEHRISISNLFNRLFAQFLLLFIFLQDFLRETNLIFSFKIKSNYCLSWHGIHSSILLGANTTSFSSCAGPLSSIASLMVNSNQLATFILFSKFPVLLVRHPRWRRLEDNFAQSGHSTHSDGTRGPRPSPRARAHTRKRGFLVEVGFWFEIAYPPLEKITTYTHTHRRVGYIANTAQFRNRGGIIL